MVAEAVGTAGVAATAADRMTTRLAAVAVAAVMAGAGGGTVGAVEDTVEEVAVGTAGAAAEDSEEVVEVVTVWEGSVRTFAPSTGIWTLYKNSRRSGIDLYFISPYWALLACWGGYVSSVEGLSWIPNNEAIGATLSFFGSVLFSLICYTAFT